ncbi:MAG: FAD-binding oxidoreductase [Pseudomonadota bacterium]
MATDADLHGERVALIARSLKIRGLAASGPLALKKATSNLFRDREQHAGRRLDLHDFNHVLDSDALAGWVDVEGMTSYESLVDWCLPRGVMPAVVPQLKTITVGGAAAGVGIEATSFRHGLVHDTLREIEVLLPGGEVVVCSPDNEHRDLFFGFPNSYGTLGYALRLKIATIPVLPFVHVRYHRLDNRTDFIDTLAQHCAGSADFVDAVAFGDRDYVVSVGSFAADAPFRSDYTWGNIYWKSLRERQEDFLTTHDYIWRWDTDWFWCSRRFGAQNPLVRRLIGPRRLNSRTYTRWMRMDAKWQLSRRLSHLRGLNRESVIQDVDIPIQHAQGFLAFLQREIGITPVWVCPVRGELPGRLFPLFRLPRAPLYLNFGFWDVIQTREPYAPACFNRRIEQEVIRLGGIKSLYSDSFFTRDEFDTAYGQAQYARLKQRYDPQGRAQDLFGKCVLRTGTVM